MGGGLMQLVAYGAQDIYLTGNPQITFFKVVYRRHTNFAMEAIEQTYSGQADYGKRFTVTIARNGDLLGRVYLQVDASLVNASNITRYGHQLIDYIEVEIGGQIIDKHYGEWMDLWCQLTHSQEQLTKLIRLIDGSLLASSNSRLYIPLQFWFCRNPGLYLPLIALQYHEVKLNINFVSESSITDFSGASITSDINDVSIYCDYVFLDTDERRRFAQVSHEYLIEQVQYNNAESISAGATTYQSELRFNHPVKELVWSVKLAGAEPFNYFANASELDTVQDALVQLNGHDRFKRREGTYFRCVQPYQHHTGANNQVGAALAGATGTGLYGGFYVYSFALKPEEHQPSGTCNFSRIDNAVLNLSLQTSVSAVGTLKVWAVNYNVLRIMSGMGGLAYSN